MKKELAFVLFDVSVYERLQLHEDGLRLGYGHRAVPDLSLIHISP